MAQELPKLPGLDFSNRFKMKHHVPQCFKIVNGFAMPREPPCGLGNDPNINQSISHVQKDNGITYDPVLTYGRLKKTPIPPFRPQFLLYDGKLLTFKAFFRQGVPESALEHYRIRFVNIIYFLEDDTITVIEPETPNSGLPQGRLIRRGKIAKNLRGECYNWKDFNIGMDIEMNGIVFHINDCDKFTNDFLITQGIDLNEAESPPNDPVTTERTIKRPVGRILKPNPKNPNDDKLRKFLEFQGLILKFDCILDETDRPNGECLTYELYYFLEDDTVAIKELKENREGRDHFPMLLKRTKLPKNWRKKPDNFAAIYLEISDTEVEEYYQPKDFRIGETIFAFGRKFLLLDCNEFTRKYFSSVLKEPQGERLCIKLEQKKAPRQILPDYLGLGTPEDSLASCLRLEPKAPRRNILQYLLNTNKFLRYGCVLDSSHPEDKIRKFILSYSLAEDRITIVEPPIRNSGIMGGKFLTSARVQLPDSDRNDPTYYGPQDFYIGAKLRINDHIFQITSADLYVYRFMMEHPEFFMPGTIENLRNTLLLEGHLTREIREKILQDSTEMGKEKNEKSIVHPKIGDEQVVSEFEECLQNINLNDNVTNPPEPDIKNSELENDVSDMNSKRSSSILRNDETKQNLDAANDSRSQLKVRFCS